MAVIRTGNFSRRCSENRSRSRSEDLIREEVQRQAAKVIADKLHHWEIEQAIKTVVNKLWNENVDRVVREELAKSDKLRAKVEAALERKIQGQLTALMKKGD